jgi:hypothetical protein
MPIWSVGSIEDEPQVEIISWRIMQTEAGTRHFVGCDPRDRSGRVSSAIQQFDPVARVGRTRSGRVYQLRGDSGYNGNAEYVWGRWCQINHVVTSEDVSERVLSETLPAKSVATPADGDCSGT